MRENKKVAGKEFLLGRYLLVAVLVISLVGCLVGRLVAVMVARSEVLWDE